MIKEMRKAAARGFLATASRTFPDAILYMPPKECPLCSLSSIFIGGRRSTLTRNQFPATHRHKYLRRAITPRQSRRAHVAIIEPVDQPFSATPIFTKGP